MKIYILLLSLFLFGCSQYTAITQSPDKYSSLPKWYVNPNQNNLQSLYGVGEGFTLQEASRSALNNIASKLIVTISSDSSSLSEENKYSFNEQYQQRIKEKVNNITFSDYKISNSSNVNNKFYVEIAIDRYKFIKEQNAILDKYHKSMSNIYQSSKKQNILIQRNKLAEINNIAKKSQVINQTLESLDSNKKYQINLSKYEFYENSYLKIMDKIEFLLDSDNNSVKNILFKALNKKNISVTRQVSKNKNLIKINIRSKASYQNIYGSNIANLQVKIKLISSNNKVISSNIIEASGASVTNNKDALYAAIKNFENKIDQEGVLSSIGINTILASKK